MAFKYSILSSWEYDEQDDDKSTGICKLVPFDKSRVRYYFVKYFSYF